MDSSDLDSGNVGSHRPTRHRPDAKTLLTRLPAADRRTVFSDVRTCGVCQRQAIRFDTVDFNKYCSTDNFYEYGFSDVNVDYWRCFYCGFISTDFFDSWSEEDFRKFIYNDDYIKMDGEYAEIRPAWVAEDFSRRLRGAEQARILDYGSGAGVFGAHLRARGFLHVEGYDPFSSPKRPDGRFDIITCFEVIEHSPNPSATIADMLQYLEPDGCILISQTLQPDDILERRGNWWYLAPRNGHISTFTEEALELIGRNNGLHLRRGETVYGLGGPAPSAFARIGLDSIGPHFTTLRLHAPSALPDRAILFPDRTTIWWHPVTSDGLRQFRWTGSPIVEWRATWPECSRLRIHVPLVRQVKPSYAASCSIVLDGIAAPARMVRGEITAEFDVAGKTGGTIELHSPDPVEDPREYEPGGVIALAIATTRDPIWPTTER